MSDTLPGPTEADLYRWQREALADLGEFLDAHAPGTASPLPTLPWLIGALGSAVAELDQHDTDPSGIRADPRAVVSAYAAALGVEVEQRRFEINRKTRYLAKGLVGPLIGTGRRPRTGIIVTADVHDQDDAQAIDESKEVRT